jgi:hypothetical protein
MKFTIEQELGFLSEALKSEDLYKCNLVVEKAIAAITDLRYRIDELGGYHDDI